MGLFQNNYNRPGPGIYKNQPKKKPFFLFWEIYFRKFWKLVQLNLLFCIPVAVVFALMILLNFATNLAVVVNLPVVLIFPFIAGIAMVTRNYAREEHAFLFSDFKDAVRNNWAAFLVNGIISYAAYVVLSVSISYYMAQMKTNAFFIVPFALCVGISLILVFAQYYIPVMMITFDLKLSQIYKNAVIFSILGLWRNLFLTVVLGVIFIAFYILFLLSPLTIIIGIALIILLLFSFIMYLINFTVYPLIHKMMITPYENNKNGSADSDFKD